MPWHASPGRYTGSVPSDVKSPRLDLTKRLNARDRLKSFLPHEGHLILSRCVSKRSLIAVSDIFSSAVTPIFASSLSTRIRVLQFLHSASGSEKPETCPDASHVR